MEQVKKQDRTGVSEVKGGEVREDMASSPSSSLIRAVNQHHTAEAGKFAKMAAVRSIDHDIDLLALPELYGLRRSLVMLFPMSLAPRFTALVHISKEKAR